jgi:hypothetical protein
MGVHEDLSGDPAMSALSAADSGTGEADDPPKPDKHAPAPEPANCTQEAVSACELDYKSCDQKGGTPEHCKALYERCLKEAPPQPAVSDDVYVRCVTKAKTCYEYESDTRICDAHMRGCETLLETQPPAPDVPDAFQACQIKAKECYLGSNEPALCDAAWKECESLRPAPDPAKVEAQRKADYAACLDKAKQCYEYEKNTEVCEQQRESCELVLDPG